MKHKVGDVVRVITPYSGGEFEDGDIVTICRIGDEDEQDMNCYGAISPHDGHMWYLLEDEVESVVKTNEERLNEMSIEEKAEFLSKIAYSRETPWSKPFQEKFCKNCPTIKCELESYDNPLFLHECDFVDGECSHGSDIVWWLQQPVKEENVDAKTE